MTKKMKLTRPELKHRRDTLKRYKKYLPILVLKQRLLQASVFSALARKKKADEHVKTQQLTVSALNPLIQNSIAGVNYLSLSTPVRVVTTHINIAGVKLPKLAEVIYDELEYSLLSSAPWVDGVIAELKKLNTLKAAAQIFDDQVNLLKKELRKTNQRLNLFEKIVIPKTQAAIHHIQIYLGDEQTAAVGRAKIAKAKQQRLST